MAGKIWKKNEPVVPYRLVLVEWEDSARPVPSWEWIDNYRVPDVISCLSVGYLIADEKTAIALAPNLGDVGSEPLQASGILRVPRSAVRKIVDLYGDFRGLV